MHIVAQNLSNAMETNPKNFELRNMRAMVPATINDFESTMRKAKMKPDAAAAFFQMMFITGQRMKKNSHYVPGVPRETRWRPINSETFKLIAGGNYHKVIQAMIKEEWIEVRKNLKTGKAVFKPDRFTKMYRIHPRLTSENETKELLRVHIITDVYIRRGIMRQMELSEEKRLLLMQAKKHLVKPVHRKILEYAEEFKLNEHRLEEDILSGTLMDTRASELIHEAISFNQGDSRFSTVDEFGHRLHFPFTNMDSELRPYLYLENKPADPISLLDFKNSQPYFLSLLMVKPELISYYVPEFLSLILELEKRKAKYDVHSFYGDCYMGIFYEKIVGEEVLTTELKNIIKKDLFKNVFYGRPRNPYRVLPKEKKSENQTPIEKDLEKVKANLKFKMLYPSVWENLYYLKKRKNYEFPFFSEVRSKHKKGNRMFTLLNCLAQRFESSIVFELAKRAFVEKIKVVSIHDAFLCEARHTDQLLAIINDFFSNELKVHPPKVKVELINNVRQ